MPHTAIDNAKTLSTTNANATVKRVRRASRVTRSSAAVVVAIVAMIAVVGIDRGATGKVSADSAVKVRFVKAGAAAPKGSDNQAHEIVMPSLARDTRNGAAPIELLHELSSGPQTVMFEVTAYCPCPKCCGPNATGLTASGRKVNWNNGRFVAADRMLPFGTRLVIPGYNNGKPVEVQDRGGAIKGNKLDVFFPTHDEARQWGRRVVAVTIVP